MNVEHKPLTNWPTVAFNDAIHAKIKPNRRGLRQVALFAYCHCPPKGHRCFFALYLQSFKFSDTVLKVLYIILSEAGQFFASALVYRVIVAHFPPPIAVAQSSQISARLR